MNGSKDTVVERVKMREVASVFHARERLESAVDALLYSGFDRSDIDISAGNDAIHGQLGVPPAPLRFYTVAYCTPS